MVQFQEFWNSRNYGPADYLLWTTGMLVETATGTGVLYYAGKNMPALCLLNPIMLVKWYRALACNDNNIKYRY